MDVFINAPLTCLTLNMLQSLMVRHKTMTCLTLNRLQSLIVGHKISTLKALLFTMILVLVLGHDENNYSFGLAVKAHDSWSKGPGLIPPRVVKLFLPNL